MPLGYGGEALPVYNTSGQQLLGEAVAALGRDRDCCWIAAVHFAPPAPGIDCHRVLLVEVGSGLIRGDVRAMHEVPDHLLVAIVETDDDLSPVDPRTVSVDPGTITSEQVDSPKRRPSRRHPVSAGIRYGWRRPANRRWVTTKDEPRASLLIGRARASQFTAALALRADATSWRIVLPSHRSSDGCARRFASLVARSTIVSSGNSMTNRGQ